ncbi:MAG TPA: hypothetical protein VLA49_19280 [Anaerolineales bacterium]|nr:hypothetical protein [Anaerolineales bacterium]
MITPEKIEEWIKEAEERPASAAHMLRFIANRLRELTERNEELLEENISLMTGKRVEEYEDRIAHLEYQLNLLKRQFGGELPAPEREPQTPAAQATVSVLVYDLLGHLHRLELPLIELANGTVLGRLPGELSPEGSPARLLVVPSSEELLFIFTSGRVATRPVVEIPLYQPPEDHSQANEFTAAPIPVEPRAGERLACLAPISRISLAQNFIQISRKGYLKKIGTSMAQSILANHYIGTGIKAPPDQTFELALGGNEDRLALVSREGYLLGVAVKDLPFAVEEVMRLGTSDHLVAALPAPPPVSLLIMTQIGKIIHRTGDSLETATSFKLKGQPAFSRARREQGVRVAGAAAVSEEDWGVALHQDGRLSLHAVRELFGQGALETEGKLLAFAGFRAL